jgi:two-component system, OmpR family, alkaline phosphatase synthesis response regulator PhoP
MITTGLADSPRRRVLVVENEVATREVLRLHLSLAGFDTEGYGDGARALEEARGTKYDLILLEATLPGIDGITLCRAIRATGVNTGAGILMLTARGSESDKVLGLESGADDYLTKPFGIRELMARASAILRRNARLDEHAEASSTRLIRSREVVLDPERRQVTVRGASVELTKQEFDLLYLVAARPGIVFSRTALLTKVWSGDTYVTERTVDTVVSRLRRKIEIDAQDPALILTAWGVGYKFADVD